MRGWGRWARLGAAGVLLVAVLLGLLPAAPAQATANTWTSRAAMPTARDGLGMAAASNGKLYAIGGYNGNPLPTVEEYDPATNTWTTRAPMPTARSDLGVAAAGNGKLYAIGGSNGSSRLATVEEYDPATNTWAPKQWRQNWHHASKCGKVPGTARAVPR